MNNNAIPGDRKTAIVVPIYRGGDRWVVGNCRPVSLTSVVCKQVGTIIIGKLANREQMLVNIPSYIGPLKAGTNYLQAY